MAVYTVEMYGSYGSVEPTWRCEADRLHNAVLSLDAMMQAYELIIQYPNDGKKVSFDMSGKWRRAALAELWPQLYCDPTNWFAIGTERMLETGITGRVSLYIESGKLQ